MEKSIPLRLQNMPPKHAHFCLRTERFCQAELATPLKGTTVVAAYSGGLDSTALLAILSALADRTKVQVHAVHVNHGLRDEAEQEEEHCRAFCAEHSIELTIRRVSINADKGIEETARKERYRVLEEERKRLGAHWIALGHHLNDLAEDVLMRLARGTGWPQLGGMRGTDANRRIMRPLLLTSRKDIEGFVKGLRLPWVEDASNADTSFTRNRIRAELVPLMLKENPRFLQSVAAMWRVAQVDHAHWDSEVRQQLEMLADPLFLPRTMLSDCPHALRLRLYKAVLETLGPGQPLAESLHKLDAAFLSGKGGKGVQFPGFKRAEISADGITFTRNEPKP